jgi:hypothetical protein
MFRARIFALPQFGNDASARSLQGQVAIVVGTLNDGCAGGLNHPTPNPYLDPPAAGLQPLTCPASLAGSPLPHVHYADELGRHAADQGPEHTKGG